MADDTIRHAGERHAIGDPAPRVLRLARELADELHSGTGSACSLGLDHSLERDYGLDSLSRAELLLRVERELGVSPGETALADAETPRDLLRALVAIRADETPAPLETTRETDARAFQHPPVSVATLVDVLDWHAERHGDRPLVTLVGERGATTQLTYARLRIDALAVAAGLADRGYGGGDAVAIMLPTGSDFFAAFYGALYAGCVPVPLYPPVRLAQLEDHVRRIAGILRNADVRVLVTVGQAKPLAHLLRAQIDSLGAVATVADLALPGAAAADGRFARPVLGADATAFLQYTSGSTGDPKGVVVSHANLLANLRAMWRACRIGSDDTFVSWLPLYHDLGLIGACIGSLYVGYRLVLLSPLAFLARPSRWLWAIDRHRATVSAAPNFAYELCVNKVPDAELDGLDLRSWRLAFNGAEPISPDTIDRFARRFQRHGFRRCAMFTVYGLAENVLGVTFPEPEREPRIDCVDRTALLRDRVAAAAAAADARALRVVSCGTPLSGHEVRVVGAAGHELPERMQGRIQFRGPSATRGYYRNAAANAALFDGDWVNTGDLGYLAAGELYLTGREKDIIVRRGANIHPAELEAAMAGIDGVRKGGVAVFPARCAQTGTERLVVLAEVRATDPEERRRIAGAIRHLALERIGMPPDDVVLAPPGSVLKTSSGKIRRATCRELYEQGALRSARRAPWWAIVRLVARSAVAQARRTARAALRVAWACRAWTAFALGGLGAWLTTMALPGVVRRRRAARAWARAALAMAGIDMRVEGMERLPPSNAVVVSNHASYVDSILLTAALPPRFAYVAKRELARTMLIGTLLRRLGAAFVERVDVAGRVEDTGVLEARARAGEALVVFPEGTFRRAPGLLPFKPGAFLVAAHTGAPIIPLALVGSRSLLRSGEWLPHRTQIVIEIGAPIRVPEHDWHAAVALRDAARRAILARVREPDAETGPEPIGAYAG